MDVIKVAVFDWPADADARLDVWQVVHHFAHLDVDVVVQHEAKAAFLVVLAKKHDLPPEVRSFMNGSLSSTSPAWGVFWSEGESNHGFRVEARAYDKSLFKVPSFVSMNSTQPPPIVVHRALRMAVAGRLPFQSWRIQWDPGEPPLWKVDSLMASNATPSYEESFGPRGMAGFVGCPCHASCGGWQRRGASHPRPCLGLL